MLWSLNLKQDKRLKKTKKKQIHKTKFHLPLPKKEMIIIDMVNFDMSYGFFGVSLNLQHKQTNLFIWNFGIGSKSLKILVALRVRWQTHNALLEFDANSATKLKERVIRESFQKKKNLGFENTECWHFSPKCI